MTCSECIHCDVCKYAYSYIDPTNSNEYTICRKFKPKSRFVELPCKVGQTVYDITEFICEAPSPDMYELKADEITIEKGTGAMRWLASSGLIKKHMINPKEVRDDKDGTNKKITGH